MITVKKIEEKTMSEAKRREAMNSYVAFYLGRPLSYLLTIPFLYTNITPNMVSIGSILCVIVGVILLSVSSSDCGRLYGLLFLFLWAMGDGIDGNIARYKNMKSANGDLLDTIGGYMATGLVYVAMGGAAFFDSNGMVYGFRELPMILGGVSAVANLLPRLLMHRKLAISKQENNVGALKDKEHYSLAKIIILNICDPAGLQWLILLVSVLLHLNTEFTIAYFIINCGIMCYGIRALWEKPIF